MGSHLSAVTLAPNFRVGGLDMSYSSLLTAWSWRRSSCSLTPQFHRQKMIRRGCRGRTW